MWGCRCQIDHSSLCDREDIFVNHSIFLRSEVPIFPIVIILFYGCVPVVVVPTYAVGFIHIPRKLGCFYSLLYSLVMLQIMEYIMARWGRIRKRITPPHYHHYTDVYESIELLKCLPGTFYRVCVYD